jgi:hypothetical protein
MKQRMLILKDSDPNADGVWITWKNRRNTEYHGMRCPKGYHTPNSGNAPYRAKYKRDNAWLKRFNFRPYWMDCRFTNEWSKF